jgi:CRP-like cAMP-binding protein
MLTGTLLTMLLLVRSALTLRQWLQNMIRMLQRAPVWQAALVFAALALLVAAIPDLLASQQAARAAAVYADAIALASGGLASLYALRLSGELHGSRLLIALRGLSVSALALTGVDVVAAFDTLLPAQSLPLPAALPLLRLIALLPALTGAACAATALVRLHRAALGWSALLGLLAVGAFCLAAASPTAVTGSMPSLTGHTLLAAALLLYWQMVRRPMVTPRAVLPLQDSDPLAVLRTTVAAVAGELVVAVAEIAGRSAQLQLAADFNRRAASADWPLWLTMDGRLGDQCSGIVERCAPIYQAALADLHDRIAAALGPALADDAQTQALAELPAPMRAVFQRWLLADQYPHDANAAAVDDDRVRLRLAGRRLAETLVIGCARVYGWSLTEEVIGGFNRTAAVAGWSLYIRGNGRIADELQGDLLGIAQTYRDAMQDLLGRIAAVAGIAFVERGVVQVYDSLPWEAREVTDTLLFRRITWARRLTQTSQYDQRSRGAERLAFLHTIRLLSWLAPDDLAALAAQLRPRRVRAERVLVARDAYLDHALIVRHGRVQAIATTGVVRRVVEEIGAGGIIGMRSILDDRPIPYEYLAQTDVELWMVPRAVVGRLGPLLHIQDSLEEQRRWHPLLAQIPLFAGLNAPQRAAIGRALEAVSLPGGSDVLTQGAESTGFYIVQTGELEVLVRAADGSERLVSMLSLGEFFGETALLRRSTVTATVRARTAVELLRLSPAAFYALLAHDLAAPLDQVQSRRAKERARFVQTTASEERLS